MWRLLSLSGALLTHASITVNTAHRTCEIITQALLKSFRSNDHMVTPCVQSVVTIQCFDRHHKTLLRNIGVIKTSPPKETRVPGQKSGRHPRDSRRGETIKSNALPTGQNSEYTLESLSRFHQK